MARGEFAEAVEVLSGSGSLTALGRIFADGMRGTVAPWLDEPVSRDAKAAARRAAELHRAQYDARLRTATDI
jgi:uncharacterized protein